MGWLSRFILFKVMGFTVVGKENAFLTKRRIFAVVPHTTNWDFILGLLVRSSIGLKVNFVGKHTLFKPPFGWILKAIGGIPVNRSTTVNFVDATVSSIKNYDEVSISLAPEGTRTYVDKFKSGFYWIAKKADLQLIPVSFDWGRKQVVFFPPFEITEDSEGDLKRFKAHFIGMLGKIPENSYTNYLSGSKNG